MRLHLLGTLAIGLLAGCSAGDGSPSPTTRGDATLPLSSVLPSASPAASPSADASPSAAPVISCAPASVAVPAYESGSEPEWQRLSDIGFEAAVVNDVAAGGPASNGAAFVAVGRTRGEGDPETATWAPAAWWSPDGLTWARASEPPDAGVILRVEDGWLAWSQAQLWFTADGDGWQLVGRLPAEDTGTSAPPVVGFVALGRCLVVAVQGWWVGEGADERYEPQRMWLSANRLDWAPLAMPQPAGWNDGEIWGIASTGDAVIAWGANRSEDGWVGVTVRSNDARTWQLGGAGLEHRGYQHDVIHDVVAGPHGLVAIGASLVGEAGEPGTTAAWTSADGLTWVRATFEVATSVDALTNVAWDGDRFLAFGRPGLAQEVWVSADGTSWRRASSVPDVALDGAEDGCTGSAICPRSWVAGVATDPGAIVAFGGNTAGDAILWTAPRLLTGP